MKQTFLSLTFFSFCSGIFCMPNFAAAQMNERAWDFTPQNRASLAALMQSIEDNERGSVANVAGSPNSTTLICGSDGESAAKGAASCIILNNSDGSISIDQISEGDQDATNTTTHIEETINGADEILATLSGEEGNASSAE